MLNEKNMLRFGLLVLVFYQVFQIVDPYIWGRDQALLVASASPRMLERMECLLHLGADPNAVTDGATPLSFAAFFGNSQGVRLLLENGADPNFSREDGRMPVDIACSMGNSELVAMLQEHGANPPSQGSCLDLP